MNSGICNTLPVKALGVLQYVVKDVKHTMVMLRDDQSNSPRYYAQVNNYRRIDPFPAVSTDHEATLWLRDLSIMLLNTCQFVHFSLFPEEKETKLSACLLAPPDSLANSTSCGCTSRPESTTPNSAVTVSPQVIGYVPTHH